MADTPNGFDREREEREAEILKKHLDSGFTGAFDAGATAAAEAAGDTGSNASIADSTQESSLRLQGGDVHRDLYRIEARTKRARLEQRAATFSHPSRSDEELLSRDALPNEPGGFRRQFLLRQHRRFHSVTAPVTNNFVSFLDLYGSFAGEDLVDDDDTESVIESEDEEAAQETRPLLPRRRTTRRTIREGEQGDASDMKSFFTLLKAFIGTGIMFLPKAFKNGGILFSSIVLVTVSIVTMICFNLLLECRKHYGGSYGEIGARVGGKKLRALILFSIAISQIGFVCAGIIFTAENLYAFAEALSPKGTTPITTNQLIILQCFVLIPLSFIRNISKLGPAALLADAFILFGLIYIYSYDISTIASRHGLHPDVQLFNPKDFTLTIGSAIFTFEGIGLILPIQASMKNPQNFNHLLLVVMFIITIVYTAVGALSYGTFGSATKTEIITNYPQSSKLVNAVQFLYSLAVLVGTPVQLFPPIRIMETKLFGVRSGKRSPSVKWKKNFFRIAIVVCSGLIAAVGAGDLDKFVALIGSFACIPLVYIYPAFLHYKGVANSSYAKVGDVAMITLGLVCMVYTTIITVKIWAES